MLQKYISYKVYECNVYKFNKEKTLLQAKQELYSIKHNTKR